MQFSLLFFSSHAAEFAADKYHLLFAAAQFADQHDFTSIWVPERHFHAFGGLFPNPSVVASALAMVTQRLRLRAGSVVLPLHHPIRVAEDWAVVDNLSQGRVDMAFAVGWSPNDFVLAPANFADRTALTFAGIHTIQALWQGQSIALPNGLGEEMTVQLHPRPKQQSLPVWLTCSGGAQRFADAGAHGFNILTALLFQSLEDLAEKIACYRKARAQHGYDPETGHVTLMLHTFIADDLEQVRLAVQAPFTRYLRDSVDLWRHAATDLEALSKRERDMALAYAFERYFQTKTLFGTPTTALERVHQLRDAGVDEIACLIDFGIHPEQVMLGLEHLNHLRLLSQETPAPGPVGSVSKRFPHGSRTWLSLIKNRPFFKS